MGLLKTWNMGEIGQLVQASRTSDGPAARAVALGSELAGRVASAGWTDASVQALIEPVAELIGTDAEHAWQQLVSSGQEAVRVAGHCSNVDLQQWIPRADDLPSFTVSRNETPCTTNALGAKGCGETGAIGAPSAARSVARVWPV